MAATVSTPTPGLFDWAEAAAWLHVGEGHLRKAVAERRYPHRRVGRNVRFSIEDLQQIAAMNVVEPRESVAVVQLRRRTSRAVKAPQRRTGT